MSSSRCDPRRCISTGTAACKETHIGKTIEEGYCGHDGGNMILQVNRDRQHLDLTIAGGDEAGEKPGRSRLEAGPQPGNVVCGCIVRVSGTRFRKQNMSI